MKKIITLNIFCLVVIMLISSCGINNSISKRHYTKGYYFTHNKSRHKAIVGNKDIKVAHQRINEPSIVAPSNQFDNGTYTTNASNVNPIDDKATLLASSSKKPIVFNTRIVSKNPVKSSPAFKIFPSKESRRSIFTKKSPVMHDGDGLSLLWIVILVLLILWALGLISGGFGLGGFINILLIIALILLILWLLRII